MPSKEILAHFWPLASIDPNERLNAAAALLAGLQESNSSADWDYALDRLLKGLASSRDAARLGFSVALAELLRCRADSLSVADLLEKIQTSFMVPSKAKGGESRGLAFGQLFALQTLAGATKLWHRALPGDFDAFAKAALALALSKPWLREPACHALAKLAAQAAELTKGDSRDRALSAIFKQLVENKLAETGEAVVILLSVPKEDRQKFMVGSKWRDGNPVSRSNTDLLANVVRQQDNGGFRPANSIVWQPLLDSFVANLNVQLEEEPRKQKKRKLDKKHKDKSEPKSDHVDLAEFWLLVIEQGYFTQQASAERKLAAFHVFLQWFPVLALHQRAAALLTPKLLKSLAQQLSQPNKLVNAESERVAECIDVLSSEQENIAAEIAGALASNCPRFDSISQRRLIHSAIAKSGSCSGKAALAILASWKKDQSFDNASETAILGHLILAAKMIGSSHAVPEIVEQLVEQAFFEQKRDKKDKKEKKSSNAANQALLQLLSGLLGRPTEVNNGVAVSYAYNALQHVKKLQSSGKSLVAQFDSTLKHALNRGEQTLEKIRRARLSSRHTDSLQLQAFELLFALVILQVYGASETAAGMLDELQVVYQGMASDDLESDSDSEQEDEGDASTVLTEILMTFMSQQSAPLRQLANDVWKALCDRASLAALQVLFDILEAQESAEGQNQLFDNDQESGEESGDESEEEGNEESEEEESEEEESEEESESESENDSEDEKTQSQLAHTLKVGSDVSGSDSEESMDDEQMAALDDQLINIFKQRKLSKSSAKDAKKAAKAAKADVTQLKFRVLDMLDVYLISCPENIDGLAMVSPVWEVAKNSNDQALANKARELLRNKLCRKTRYKLVNDSQQEVAKDLLDRALLEASQAPAKPLVLLASQLAVLAAKLLVAQDPKAVELVAEKYCQALVKWYNTPQDKLTPTVFVDLVNFLATKREGK